MKFATFALCFAASAEPFAFREIPLGMDLAAFRNVPFPDAVKYPKSRVICSTDLEAAKMSSTERPIISDVQRRIGVTSCNFYSLMNGQLFRNGPDFANIGGYETTFYFSPPALDADKRQKLYLVAIAPLSGHYKTISDALTVRYGQPAEITTGVVQNRAGASFANESTVWVRAGSTIVLKKYDGRLGQASVLYFLNDLIDATNAATASVAAENARKL